MNYKGKPISEFSNEELLTTCHELAAVELAREEASKHEKFNIDRQINNKKVPKMDFPPPNPKFLELKLAIQTEINNRKL